MWIKDECKRLCNEWNMTRLFQILECDLVDCLATLEQLQLPPLATSTFTTTSNNNNNNSNHLNDILMLVCVALRTKLICEIKANVDNLKVNPNDLSSFVIHPFSSYKRSRILFVNVLCFPLFL